MVETLLCVVLVGGLVVVALDTAGSAVAGQNVTQERGRGALLAQAMMAEILCGLLAGAIPSMLTTEKGSKHYFAAYNIAAFTDVEEFKDTMDRTLHTLKTTKPAPGHDRVLYPGLPEYEDEQERRANGIPLHKEVIQWFEDITSELSVPGLQTL